MELPEYGRSVQNMVDHALTIEDRAERQRCANTIINIMGGMFPHLRDVPDFKHKLWDHLAIMSDFKLDIDYPFEIVKKEDLVVKPEKLEYPNGALRYRHYGRFLEGMIKKAIEVENEGEKKQLINLLAIQMKKDLNNWNKEGIEDQKIVDDLREYTNGVIDLKVEDLRLGDSRGNNNNQQRKQNFQQRKQNNQKKKH
jgi:hypothetical protein